jgi:signal transduction histidine kinase
MSRNASDDLLAMVSHDLRNPLGTIMMAAQLLLEELVPEDEAHRLERRQLGAIRRAATRMDRIVGDLLDATALHSGRLHVALVPHGVRALIDDACEMLQPMATARCISLEIAVSGELPDILADHDRLLQVFANVGGNAVKFTPAGGCVTLGVRHVRDAVVFEVSDTGTGISPEHLPFVFDRFWQAPHTARLGTGLGLAIARGIVEAHAGCMEAASTPGQGSTFRFFIPTLLPS